MRHLDAMAHGIRRVFRLEIRHDGDRERELDEEIQFHIEQRAADLIALGLSPEQARAEALARFGPYDESRERLLESARSRDEVLTMIDRFENFSSDARYALRQLARSPGLSAAIALTFALGIGVNAAMFAVIDRLLLRPPAYVSHPETITAFAYGLKDKSADQYFQRTMNYPVYKAVRDRARGFTDVAATFDTPVPIGRGEAAQNARGLLVSGNYFHLLGAPARLGRVIGPDDDREPSGEAVVVLSYDYWTSHFGADERALGRTLDIANRRFTIIGVMPPGFSGLTVEGADLWMPLSAGAAPLGLGGKWATNNLGTWLRVFARQQPGVPVARAAEDAMRVAREAAPAAFFTGPRWNFGALPLRSIRGESAGMTSSVARVLAAMSFIVLLVACSNVANLLLARGLRRRSEIAVRLALGVSRGRLVSHLLTESALLALLGGVVALLVAYWGGNIVFTRLFTDLSVHDSAVNVRVLAFTAVVTIATGVLTGLIPAWQTSRLELGSALRSGDREVGHSSRTRSVLLVAQAAMAVTLLFAAGLFVRSLAHLGDVRLGVDVDRVAVGTMDMRVVSRTQAEADLIFAAALDRVTKVPGVSHAAIAATSPFGAAFGANVTIHGRDSLVRTDAMLNVISPDYFRTLGARMLRGRDFAASDAEGAPRTIVVNEMWATRYYGAANPIGQCVDVGDSLPCAQIVGVVENVRRQSIFEDSTGSVYLPLAQGRRFLSNRQLLVRIENRHPAGVLETVRLAMQTAAPGLPYADVQLLADNDTVRREFRPYRLGAILFGVFGLLALSLAAVGIYGVISYNVGQRRREMGVRIALGAQRRSVATLVVRQGVAVTAVGVAIGALVALVGSRVVSSLLYNESARDPLVLGAVMIVLLATAVVACVIPAWRAVNTDPVTALRSD